MAPPNGHPVNDNLGVDGDLLKKLDLDALVSLVALGADIVMFVDEKGIISRVRISDPKLDDWGVTQFAGKRLADCVTIESVPKIETMLTPDVKQRPARGYQVNHPARGKSDLPVVYSAHRTQGFPLTLVIGRDLRQQSLDQQRLIETQMAMESDYRALQEAEARYRTAFKLSAVAHLMLDGDRKSVLDANASAMTLLGSGKGSLTGKSLRDMFGKQERERLGDAISEARHSANPVLIDNIQSAKGDQMSLSLRSYRENGATNLFVSLWPSSDGQEARKQRGAEPADSYTLDLSEVPEAAVQTNADGQIQAANTLFLDFVHAPSLSQVLGRHIGYWFTKATIDIHVLFSRLVDEVFVRGFSSVLTDNLSGDRPVSLSARQNPETGTVQILVIPQVLSNERIALPPPRTADQAEGFASLVGKVPLKELIRESLDVIEKICIEAALDQTNNNRASAAEILGLSRQSLYIKLRRHRLEDYRPAS
jgi:transcriptional regulator PpsR